MRPTAVTPTDEPRSDNSAPAVTVIVLNWNGRDDTLACLESLRAVEYPNFSVMVVDNGSSDGSPAAIRQRFPDIEVVETNCNLGFAEGNNVGIRLALRRGSDYVLLLNNDTVVATSLLQELVAGAERCPEGGIFTARIHYHADPQRIWSAGVRWRKDRMEFSHVQDEAENPLDARGLALTDYACGCALFAPAAVFRKVGLLDPKFFLTYEETDLCFRARRSNIPSYYVPSALLWHKVSASFGGAESPLIEYFMTRNRLLWGERHLGFKDLLQLYKVTWWEVRERFVGGSNTQPAGLIQRWRQFRKRLAVAWRDPSNQAVALGALHYILRRFGDAPTRVRELRRAKSLPIQAQ
jgi:GT2 family glycosyltransferase